VFSTANYHSLDKGYTGLVSTLDRLDELQIAHTGTARSIEEQNTVLVKDVNGIKIAFLSYTYGTNGIPVPSGREYCINLINDNFIVDRLNSAKEKNPDIIESFARATYKGQKWAKEHSAREIAEAVISFFPDTSVESLENSIQSYKNIDAWNETPILKKEAFDKLQLIMTEAGELKTQAPYDKVVNNKYAEKVTAE